MSKIQEKRYRDAGGGGGHWEYRVRTLEPSEQKPEGSLLVPDNTAEYDWLPEHLVDVVTEEEN